MKTYDIYKKRAGQDFKIAGSIFESDFESAKKQFAKQMTEDNHQKSNDIVWLTKDVDGVETGWYDLNASILISNETGEINYAESKLELLCSEKSILEGFDSWTEDVYTWELREPEDELEYQEIYDQDSLNLYLEDYKYFMAYNGTKFFLYNGDFSKIAEAENLENYSQQDDRYMGSGVDDLEFINSYFVKPELTTEEKNEIIYTAISALLAVADDLEFNTHEIHHVWVMKLRSKLESED
jgi:hypothetical protein